MSVKVQFLFSDLPISSSSNDLRDLSSSMVQSTTFQSKEVSPDTIVFHDHTFRSLIYIVDFRRSQSDIILTTS